ncbi:TPA: hypothetical protein QEM76_003028 [Pseudomonas putida]|nr:hypothetical protein [Pseudomonas putida]HDS1799918.1 hypothetical protein [Pseudomonas putida]HDS1806312.1 hypothetical protein [Pseudomonas putida]
MADMTPQDMAGKLLAAGFQRNGPTAAALSDPIADTPMIVTLDQLRPYDHDPRVKRNPAYDDIKASIRERGLDAPPAITRRPGGEHYIIRNGGNTRLAILRELWSETKQEHFYRISCLFRPWPERGEIVALTGHLAENELRGGLTFIERALGVEKAREFYELETGNTLSQSELARRLSADGYPVQQSHISRMQDAVHYLLPAIPNVLYGGLGRHQVERIAVMRKASERIWERYASTRKPTLGFEDFFLDALAQFDSQPDEFSAQRVQDEVVGQMAEVLGVDYDTLSLDLNESESRQRALISEPSPLQRQDALPDQPGAANKPLAPASQPTHQPIEPSTPVPRTAPLTERRVTEPAGASSTAIPSTLPTDDESAEASHPAGALVQQHIVSRAPTTERLQSIQRLVAGQLGDALPPDFEQSVLQAIPVQAGGLYPISDVWYIDPSLDVPEHLRVHIAQFAREIADEALLADRIIVCDDGIGFRCQQAKTNATELGTEILMLLASLSGQGSAAELDRLPQSLPQLLHGKGDPTKRLSDTALVKLFRLLRLARRLLDLESGSSEQAS